MPARNLLILCLAAFLSLVCYHRAARNRYSAALTQAMNIINAQYLDEVQPRVLYEGAMTGITGKLDPYSSYESPKEYEQFDEHINQEFGGIGVLVEMNQDTKRITIMSPLVGTPAYKAGVKAGDVILAIDGKDTENMTLKDTVELIHGPKGKPVLLKLQRPGQDEPLEVSIVRDKIQVDSVLGDRRRNDGHWRFKLPDLPQFTYVRLSQFGKNTAAELEAALKSQNSVGVILDLRGNAGGLLTAAVGTCDLFLDQGEVVSTRGRDGTVQYRYVAKTGTAIPNETPLVILIDRFSASASEIVAACLQDHGRAKVVGQRSWGKGTVQNLISLGEKRGALRLTIASYWRPSGKNIHKKRNATDADEWGVRPDEGYEVVLTDEEMEKILRARRQRDALLFDGDEPADEQPSPIDGDEPEKLEALGKVSPAEVDPQLKKAIEVLKEMVRASQGPRKA